MNSNIHVSMEIKYALLYTRKLYTTSSLWVMTHDLVVVGGGGVIITKVHFSVVINSLAVTIVHGLMAQPKLKFLSY